MRVPRVLLPNIQPEQQSRWVLDKEIRHYLINVLRLKTGRELLVFDGQNERESKATLISADKKSAEIELIETYPTQRESPLRIKICLGISKSDHMDMGIQKSVELGVSEIQPVICERSQSVPSGERLQKKIDHWNNIVVSACEQSGRCIKPSLLEPLTFEQCISQTTASPSIILSPIAKDTLPEQTGIHNGVNAYIGPEGGFSSDEEEKAKNSGVRGIRMGPRVLRTETAVITTISGLQFYFGDLNKRVE